MNFCAFESYTYIKHRSVKIILCGARTLSRLDVFSAHFYRPFPPEDHANDPEGDIYSSLEDVLEYVLIFEYLGNMCKSISIITFWLKAI